MSVSATDDLLVAKLRERSMRVTPQRLMIHRALCAREQHLTAEQVLETVSANLPGTSLPTVYSTLELFEELGLIRRLSTVGRALFDSRTTPHAHTSCRVCGAIADIDPGDKPTAAFSQARAHGFHPDHAELVLWGLCESCASARASELSS